MGTTSKDPIHLGDIEVRFLVDDEESAGRATMFETRVAAGAKVPAAHSHDGFEEAVYGLEGVMTFTIDGVVRAVAAGEAAYIRRGQVHKFENRSAVDASFLSVATPGVFRPAYFHEIGAVLSAAKAGPPDMAAVVEVMRRHGLTPVVPAPAA